MEICNQEEVQIRPRQISGKQLGGSVIAGEESLEAALREVKEEIGVELKTENGGLLRRIRFDTKHPWIGDIFIILNRTLILMKLFLSKEK